MGALCLKPKAKSSTNQNPQTLNTSKITAQDKAILDIKSRLRKLKTHYDKLMIQKQQQQTKIKEFIERKQKDRALIALKHKKFLEKEIEKAQGAQSMLEKTILNIESAQMDVIVYEALKKGDQVINELQERASLEDFEELYEKHQGHLERQKMDQELFGQVMNDEDLEDELEKLEAMRFEEEMPEAGKGYLEARNQEQSQKQKQPIRQQQPQMA